MATKSAVIAIAMFGTLAAFFVGAHAGAALNGRAASFQVARVPMPTIGNQKASPVTTHVR